MLVTFGALSAFRKSFILFGSTHIWYRILTIKAGLYRYANTNAACENDAYVYVGKFVNCSAFAEAADWPYINVLYTNSLWCTDSRRIAFGCSPNVRHTNAVCLASGIHLHRTFASFSNVAFAFCSRSDVNAA